MTTRATMSEEERLARQRVELLLKSLFLPHDSEFARAIRKALRANIQITLEAYLTALAKHAEATALIYRLALCAVQSGNYDTLEKRWRDFWTR